MRVSEAYGIGRFGLSFELFPPKTEAGVAGLRKNVAVLDQFEPSFITCTYGAGGSTRDKTLDILAQVRAEFQRPVASHLTCVGATVQQLLAYLRRAADTGIENIVALRGDPPRDASSFQPVQGGLTYANELVSLIREEFPQFGIAVAGYPETHQEAPDSDTDLANLKRKVECGADAVITQLFYSNQDFYAFRERYEREGISVPLVPGLLPVTNFSQIQRISSLCGAKLPAEFVARLTEREDEEWQFRVGVEFATAQAQDLLENGVPGMHFYVLNKSKATSSVLSSLSLPGRD